MVSGRYNVTNMFFGIGKHGPDARYGALLDVGSGSAGVAIIVSAPEEKNPKIIWSYRERISVGEDDTEEQIKKRLKTAIFNALLELGNTGVRELKAYDNAAKIKELLVSYCAPWTYTITRNVNVENENPFTLNHKIVDALINKAAQEAKTDILKEFAEQHLNLTVLNDTTVEITANGYRVHDPNLTEIRKVTLAQLVSMTESDLFETVKEVKEKTLTGAKIVSNSFMYNFYNALADLYPDTSEICLVDITAEATEVGIVRNNVLVHTTAAPFGIYTLAREISKVCEIPKEEALGVMRENATNIKLILSPAREEEFNKVLKSYSSNIAELFKKTGDRLSIPKTIFMHTDAANEAFFNTRLVEAANLATGSTHAVHPITSSIFEKGSDFDSAILLSAYVFHKKLHKVQYLQE